MGQSLYSSPLCTKSTAADPIPIAMVESCFGELCLDLSLGDCVLRTPGPFLLSSSLVLTPRVAFFCIPRYIMV